MGELRVIYTEREVRDAQEELKRTLQSQMSDLGQQAVTFRPNFVEMDLYGKGQGRLYFGPTFVASEQKLWNSFGIFDRTRPKQDIVVEINFSVGGRRTAGLLAEDDAGRRLLLHSGGVGGGKKGVSQDAFLAWLKPAPVAVLLPNGTVTHAILIGELGAANLADRIESFVRSVKAFKDAVGQGLIDDPSFARQVQLWRDYREEFAGRKRGAVAADLDYVSYHGDIVGALKDWLEARVPSGHVVTNSPLIDLLVHRQGHLVEVYEVKTRTARQALYTAIGQLVVHAGTGEVARTLVLPHDEDIPADMLAAIGKAGIHLLRYRINKNDTVSILGKIPIQPSHTHPTGGTTFL